MYNKIYNIRKYALLVTAETSVKAPQEQWEMRESYSCFHNDLLANNKPQANPSPTPP